ncbi:neuraminidase-like domain-containing protein [Providencia stuartii]|nr:neuraminidase-like domain-containing protein [Providencia stuartii]
MPSFEMISNKVNKLSSKALSLADIMLMSQEQLHEQFSHILNRNEIVNLYEIAQEKYNENRLFESQLLARINPQTSALQSLNIKSLAEKHSYIDMFPERSNYFVREGSVSSSFSPAAYLTELYREALPIHDKQSIYNLGNRRPDISHILLSQENMDAEISTLTYANEILVSAISSIMLEPPDKIEEKLSSCRQGGGLPYHHAYNTVRLGIFQQDPHLKTIKSLPFLNQLLAAQRLTALSLNLPPESFAILTESITRDEEKVNALYEKNFEGVSESDLSSINQLSRYYQVATDEIATLIELTRLSCGFSDVGDDGHYSALFLLYFNKMVRLFWATELTIQDMERIVLNTDLPIDKLTPDIIYQIAHAKIFVQQGYLTLSEAFILTNAMIGIRSTSLQVSQFDLLFNTPLLDGKRYEFDEQLITVHPDKLLQGESFHRSVLKRSFKVDDAGLWLLHQMGSRNHSVAFNNTRETLSDLYRIVLLARAHALTIDELEIILQLSDYREVPLYDLDNDQLHEIIDYISKITLWLAEQKWSVYQLFIMVGDITSTVWTPALDDLQQTLLNGIGAAPNLHGEALVTRMAPFFVSTLSLNSNYISELCLHWVNQIKPNGQTTDKFWQLIQKKYLTDAERADVIAFTQTLTQLSIIINQIHLSEQELDLIIKKPSLLISSLSELGLTTEILLQLTQFHQWVNGSGEFSNDVLTALNHQQLSAEILASSLNDDVEKVGQALILARQIGLSHNHNDDVSLPTPERTYLGHWDQVSIAIQLLRVSNLLNITPDGIVQLLELSYDPKKGYSSWAVQSHLIQGALKQPDNETVYHQLEEQWGNALNTFYRLKAAPVPLSTRDDVYYYLLIDNQVSGTVTTSRIAETIASLQLYIYRELNDLEDKTESGVISRPFFINWDQYNARYSTWAGCAQLLYYPENYLDPTMRIGQTQMMDGMLQDISQSNLTPDTIETAFNSYLSQFEQIANLNIVSGYHNNINFDNGFTYLIGHSADSSGFYWRSVDQGQFNEDGKFPASAWSEWKGIQMGINAVQDWVRPFIFNSRLHVAWVEKEKKTDSNNQPIDSYVLKISKLNYNGTWAAINSFSLDSTLRIFSKDKLYQVGFYCSLYSNRVDGLEQDTIYVLFYTKKEFYSEEMLTTASGLFIYPNMTTKAMSSQDSKNIIIKVHNDLDTLQSQHLIKKITKDNYLYNKFQHTYIYAKYGYDNLTMVSGSGLSNINVVESGNRVITLSLDANLSISYRGEGTRQREQCNMMKKYYNHVPSEFVIYPQQTLVGKPLYNVVHMMKTEGRYKQNILLNNPSAADFYVYNLGSEGGSWPIQPSEEYYRLSYSKESTTPIRRMEVSDSANNKSKTDGYYDINTALPPPKCICSYFFWGYQEKLSCQ